MHSESTGACLQSSSQDKNMHVLTKSSEKPSATNIYEKRKAAIRNRRTFNLKIACYTIKKYFQRNNTFSLTILALKRVKKIIKVLVIAAALSKCFSPVHHFT